MSYPEDLMYSKEHEWLRVTEGEAELGITAYAQDELGDVVFVELPSVGDTFAAHEELGTIESVKAVAEIYTPVGGEVLAVNEAVTREPELLNRDPHGEGWLLRLRLLDLAELEVLMNAEAYAGFIAEES